MLHSRSWVSLLEHVQKTYNNTPHDTLKRMTPSQVLYGHKEASVVVPGHAELAQLLGFTRCACEDQRSAKERVCLWMGDVQTSIRRLPAGCYRA